MSVRTGSPQIRTCPSAQLCQALRDYFRGRDARLRALMHQCPYRRGEGYPKRSRPDRADQSSRKPGKGIGGQVVVTTRLHCHNTVTQAGKRQCVITHGANVMLGLPNTLALDARAHVKRIDDAPPENVPRDRWRINEQAPRRRGNSALIGSHLPEDKPQQRAVGAELSRRCHRDVHLKRTRQQEYAVSSRTTLKISEHYRVKLISELRRPIIKHLAYRYTVSDAESKVQVGEPVAATINGERAHNGSGYDPVILLRQVQHTPAKDIPLLNGEHSANVTPADRRAGPGRGCGVSAALLDQSELAGPADRLAAMGRRELAVDALDVCLDGVDGDAHLAGDLGGAEHLGEAA
jgi:hypothetical protein